MKTFPFHFVMFAALFSLGLHLHSQAPVVPKTPAQQLQALKEKNQEIIGKQTATLQQLEELAKQAEQLKALGKRT